MFYMFFNVLWNCMNSHKDFIYFSRWHHERLEFCFHIIHFACVAHGLPLRRIKTVTQNQNQGATLIWKVWHLVYKEPCAARFLLMQIALRTERCSMWPRKIHALLDFSSHEAMRGSSLNPLPPSLPPSLPNNWNVSETLNWDVLHLAQK